MEKQREAQLSEIVQLTKEVALSRENKESVDSQNTSKTREIGELKLERTQMEQRMHQLVNERDESISVVKEGKSIIEQQQDTIKQLKVRLRETDFKF